MNALQYQNRLHQLEKFYLAKFFQTIKKVMGMILKIFHYAESEKSCLLMRKTLFLILITAFFFI